VCHSVRLEFGKLEGPEIVTAIARSMLSSPGEMTEHHKTHYEPMNISSPQNNNCTYTGDALRTRTRSFPAAHLSPQPKKYLLKCLEDPQLRQDRCYTNKQERRKLRVKKIHLLPYTLQHLVHPIF
jgi:hypothetical protein